MKEKLNIKNISVLLSVIGLALMLVISPCKVRNYIQLEFGIAQIEASNKSKSTIGVSTCNTFEISEIALASSKPSIECLSTLVVDKTNFTLNINNFPEKLIHFNLRKPYSLPLVPFYILYQNFKIYL